MCSPFDKRVNALAAYASLAAEAGVLAARWRTLQADLASVDARITAVSEALRRLHHDGAESGHSEGDVP
ncbi:hypothetical protein [Actinacidiphila rubida]|uniref:Uncharacterized protein n=1 Tax=Actinacidiphila rubida TaxID=310780 RepID=A0A1H8K9P0_9ACTN|nr:hypothetical protein [Actinacidiphila rubida]SEN89216.1 hypothetical protein SAMN05216267_101253 [Actinacidiphila rubida]